MNRRNLLATVALSGVAGAVAVGAVMLGSERKKKGTHANLTQSSCGPASAGTLRLVVNAEHDLHRLDRRIFGTNLEWFNDAGGLASRDGFEVLSRLAKEMGTSVFRFPGGVLSDYYHWQDGIGPIASRPTRKHPTDSGSSRNTFGTPEFFELLDATGAQGLITVNAGTGTADEAASWVAYCNDPKNSQRLADGLSSKCRVDLWEVGNELYFPENAGEPKVGVEPSTYAERFERFALAMKRVDPRISIAAIGLAQDPPLFPSSPYAEWNDLVLSRASRLIDMLAVHNAYFPLLNGRSQVSVEEVYSALLAAPDAVEDSLRSLGQHLARYERGPRTPIGIAVTEWGALFSLPDIDPYWTNHNKTLGSALYLARMLQVFMRLPRVSVANHFKLVDRSFMGVINYEGHPKVPYTAFRMMAMTAGSHLLETKWEGAIPEYDSPQVGIIAARHGVQKVTVAASRSGDGKQVYVSLINRSLHDAMPLDVCVSGVRVADTLVVNQLTASEPTAHNGRDWPPELPYTPSSEPYSTVGPAGVVPVESKARTGQLLVLPPISLVTLTYSVRASSS
jgi:alpha-N-arabinofuranosidase